MRNYQDNMPSSAYDRLLEIIFGNNENVDVEAIKACRIRMLHSRRKAAIHEANDMLKRSGHAVCRRDMLIAIGTAIMNEVKTFETAKTQENAISHMALDGRDPMLKNGTRSEEEGARWR